MIHKITYTLVAGVAFWTGTLHNEASKPVPQFKRVSPPVKLTPALTPVCENLVEIRRACTHRWRSALVKPLER